MKLLGYLIMTICLCAGCIAATTAYSPPLSLPDATLIGLRLANPAGAVAGEHGEMVPLVDAEKTPAITAEVLATLRASGVKRVHVKEFSFATWPLWWVMAASIVGLVVGAMFVKTATRKQIRESAAAAAAQGETPEHAVATLHSELERLANDMSAAGDNERFRLNLIVDRVGEMQRGPCATIGDARARLTGMLGLSGFAEFMDRFSTFERQLNRAWSAAADEVLGESERSLAAARELLPEVEGKLNREA